MSGWAAVAQVAMEMADKFIDSRSGSSVAAQSRKARQFAIDDRTVRRNRFLRDRDYARDFFEQDRDTLFGREDSTYQRAVADAQAAGLHPLFAMGAASPGGGSHTFGTPEDRSMTDVAPAGGSVGGAGLARGGEAIARAILGDKGAARATEKHKSEMKVNEALANLYESQAARALQESVSGPRMNEDGAIVYPLGAKRGLALETARTHIQARPTVAKPNVSAPLRQELIGDDGYRYRVLTDDAGDELKQMDLVYQGIMRMTRKARLALPRELKLWYGRQQIRRGKRKQQPQNRRNF